MVSLETMDNARITGMLAIEELVEPLALQYEEDQGRRRTALRAQGNQLAAVDQRQMSAQQTVHGIMAGELLAATC